MPERNSIFSLRKKNALKPEFKIPSSEKNYLI